MCNRPLFSAPAPPRATLLQVVASSVKLRRQAIAANLFSSIVSCQVRLPTCHFLLSLYHVSVILIIQRIFHSLYVVRSGEKML